jgi:hypothetical protein
LWQENPQRNDVPEFGDGFVLSSINSLVPEIAGSNNELLKASSFGHRSTLESVFSSDTAQ